MGVGVRRCLCLAVGCLGGVVIQFPMTFGFIANAVKETFHYTQSEVELVGSFLVLGYYCGFPTGWLLDKRGPLFTSVLILFVITTGYLMLLTAVFYREFYLNTAYLLSVHAFITGFGATSMYINVITTNTKNAKPQHRARVICIFSVSCLTGAVTFSSLYVNVFYKGESRDDQTRSLQEYFSVVFVLSVTVALIHCFFIRNYPHEHDKQPQDDTGHIVSNFLSDTSTNITGLALLKNWNFHYLLWGTLLVSACHTMVMNNVSVFLKSMEMNRYSSLISVLMFITPIFCKIVIGFVVDKLRTRVPAILFVLAVNLLLTVSLFLCIFFANNIYILCLFFMATGVSYGVLWLLLGIILIELFGVKTLSSNFGIVMTGSGAGAIAGPKLFGILYESKIATEGELYCYGKMCFTYSFTSAAVFAFCTCVLFHGIFTSQLPYYRKSKEPKTELILCKPVSNYRTSK